MDMSNERPESGPVSQKDRGCPKEELPKTNSAEQKEDSPVDLASELENLKKERDEWKAKAETFWDQFLRARADMDNFRKRTERDIQESITRGKSDFILSLLDPLDNFQRFLDAAEKDEPQNGDSSLAAFFKGVKMIHRQILDVLAKEGVEPIEDPVGKVLDPYCHEAVLAQDGGGEHGTIVEEFQKGYTYRGKVVRPSRVKVIR